MWRDKELKEVYIIHKNKNNPYKKIKSYDQKTGHLIFEKEEFGGQYCKIGTTKEYDRETGKLIKETNHEALYPFSLPDLIQKFKKEYNTDIENPETILNSACYRYTKEACYKNQPVYAVSVLRDTSYEAYYIDGKTGETLFYLSQSLDPDKEVEPGEAFCKAMKDKGLDK